MMRVRYKLFNGTIPNKAIVAATKQVTKFDIFMGKYRQKIDNDEWMLGHINISDPVEKAKILAACTAWEMEEFASDKDACDFADATGPAAGTVISPKMTVGAAIVENGKVVKPITEDWS